MTSDYCRVTVQRLFSKIFRFAWNVDKNCLTVGRRSRDLRRLSRDRSATFFKIFPICLKRREKLFDSRPTVAWPPTTVAWPFSDFFQNFAIFAEMSKYNCLTVGRRSSDLRRLSRDRSATFSEKCPICLKRQKNLFDSRQTVAWAPATVTWPFSDYFQNFAILVEMSKEKLFDSRPTVAWPPTTVAWPFSDFFQKISNLLETSKKCCLPVGQRSRDLWRLSSKLYHFCWNVEIKLFDSQPTVTWPPTTIAWLFSNFFQNFAILVKTFKKVLDSRRTVAWPSYNCRATDCSVTFIVFVILFERILIR